MLFSRTQVICSSRSNRWSQGDIRENIYKRSPMCLTLIPGIRVTHLSFTKLKSARVTCCWSKNSRTEPWYLLLPVPVRELVAIARWSLLLVVQERLRSVAPAVPVLCWSMKQWHPHQLIHERDLC